MEHIYGVKVADLLFDVSFDCNSEGDDAEISLIDLSGHGGVDVSGLYYKNDSGKYVELEDHLLNEAFEMMLADGGALHAEELSHADHLNDVAKGN